MYHIADMRDVDFSEEWSDPADLFSFLQISNSTLEDIYIGDLYFDPTYEEPNPPSSEFLKEQLPFPNLISLALTFEIDGYEEPVKKYFPKQKEVRERAKLRSQYQRNQ